MALDQKKLQAKKAKRNAKNKSRQEKLRVLAGIVNSPYPKFIFDEHDTNTVADEFVDAIRHFLKSFSFENDLQVKQDKELYKSMKKYGFHHAVSDLAFRFEDKFIQQNKREGKDISSAEFDRTPIQMYYGFQIGNILFQHLKADGILQKYLPTHDCELLPYQDYHVRIRALRSHKDRDNTTLYYSWKKPQIEIRNKKYTVSFSKHALERIALRCVIDPLIYRGSDDVFVFIAHCTYFEPVILEGENREMIYGLTFYDSCMYKSHFVYKYVKHLIGEIIPHKKYYYRLGYCPLALSGDFAKTITFLTPGMYETTEYRLIQDIDNAKERYAISRSKENITSLRKHGETDDFDAIKYFHAHGIPQVIASDKDFFDYT